MTTQSTLKDFFKPKLPLQSIMDNRKKKLNLSLNKVTPTKTPKLYNDKSVEHLIELDSDDENYLSEPFIDTLSPSKSASTSSDTTVIYSPETPRKSSLSSNTGTLTNSSLVSQSNTGTPISLSPQSNEKPFKSPSSSQSNTPRSNTGTPKRVFYSPTKKRLATSRTPTKARRNLSNTLFNKKDKDEDFIKKSNGLDDKTIFMLEIIDKFSKEESLWRLLNESSCNLLKEFISETNIGLKLVCNLYGRKERWFRWDEMQNIISKKNQAFDDSSCHIILNSLLQKGFLAASNYQGHKHNLSFDEYVAILKKDDILAICKQYKLKGSGKQDSIKLLRGFSKQKCNISAYFKGTSTSNNESRVMSSLAEKLGACFKLSELTRKTLDELYILMYLGMDYTIIKEKKLELTLINDKANIQTFPYKNIKTDNASVVFKSREEFESYLNALSIYNQYSAETDLNKQCDWVKKIYQMYKDIGTEAMQRYSALPVWLHKFTPPNIFIKLLEDGIKYLKQDKKEESISLALEILSVLITQSTFRQHKKPEWYAEKALITDKFTSNSEEAALILLEGLNLDLRDEAKDVLRRRASLLAKRRTNKVSKQVQVALLEHAEREERLEKQFNAEHIYKLPMDKYGAGKIRFETRTESGILVQDAEDYCLSHYIQNGKYTHGGHWEGRIVTTIFFLLFWDEIYGPVPGVPGLALCPLQPYPLDLFGDGFHRNRAERLQQRLQQVERAPVHLLLETMRRVWDTRPESEVSGIQRGIPWDHVAAVCECLGAAPVAAVCRRLTAHYGYAHSGFPDLTLWNCHTKKIAFVEVKTDSDRPSMKQLQWMQYLQQNGITTEFCYVGLNTTRCRARRKLQD